MTRPATLTRQATLPFLVTLSLVTILGYAANRGSSYGSDADGPRSPRSDQQGTDPNELDGASDRGLRLREGMKFVSQLGELKEAGGRIVFYPEGQTHSLQLLENLALERILDDVGQTHRKWSVTGIVTEYRGGNYLLLQRAVLKARASNAPGPRS